MAKHLAGIVPLANFKDNFKLPYHSFLLPIENDFTLIQKSVFECAMAGCSTIWIVANDDLAPMVKRHIGEWVYDPVYFWDNYINNHIVQRRIHIPIYYVPILPKDRNKRDSYGWSALFGMHSAWYISYRISKWVIPKKYFVSFPHGMMDFWSLREQRTKLSSSAKNFFFTHNGKTVKDNLPIPFTMRGEDFIQCRRNVNKITTKSYMMPEGGKVYTDMKRLSAKDRWSARHFDLATIFDKVSEDNCHRKELDWFYDFRQWEGYRAYLASDNLVKAPDWRLTKPHKLNKLCVDERGSVDA